MILSKQSPLRLLWRCLPVIRLEASPAFGSAPKTNEDPYANATIVTKQEVIQDSQQWKTSLTVECWPEESIIVPYRFRLEAYAIFRVEPGIVPVAEEQRFVACNAPAILYAWCRDMLRNLTSAGPYAQMELPMVFFTVHNEGQGGQTETSPGAVAGDVGAVGTLASP